MAVVSTAVKFSINGKQYSVNSDTSDLNPESKLIDFIRDSAKLKGTKYLCREGGCGACVVNVTRRHPLTGKESTKSLNSCLTPVLSCDGWDISTIEDLGNRQSGYDSIQKRLAEFCGTQCGFCTPGMVMSMKGLLASKESLSVAEIENGLDGNICRCTGYRPILDAFKSFGNDASPELRSKCGDIEDCLETPCPLNKSQPRGKCCKGARLPIMPGDEILMNFSGTKWLKIHTLQSLYDSMQKLSGTKYRMVAGNTGIGIFKDDAKDVKAFLDISSVRELVGSSTTEASIIFGGGTTITEAISVLKEASLAHKDFKYAGVIAQHFSGRVANTHVRNNGTLGGNLVLKHKYPGFASDIFLLFETVGAQITLGCSKTRQSETMSMTQFLEKELADKVVFSIQLHPIPQETILRTFKISPRYQNSKGYLNAAILFRVEPTQNFKVVEKPVLVFGGVHPKFCHATATEDFLAGKHLGEASVVRQTLEILASEINPVENVLNGSSEYRRNLAVAVVYKTILGLLGEKASKPIKLGGLDLIRGIRTGRQSYVKNSENTILYKGFPKLEAVIQCSGEAEYTNDIQHVDGELFGAFILSTVANAKLKSIDPSQALNLPGVVRFISAQDIPGPNNYMVWFWDRQPEEIFASTTIHHAGQPLGLILAENRATAFAAAKLVQVDYEDVSRPILSIHESLEKARAENRLEQCTVKTLKSNVQAEPSSDENTLRGEFSIGSQHHFQMEPHVTLSIPKEDGLDVYSATQWIEKTQAVISSCCQIPVNNINVQVRRLGGGFGGKVSRSGQVAAASAIAAVVTHRPVRVVLDLETHMRMVGKRLPWYIKYEVGFDPTGKISRLHLQAYCDSGFSPNEETTIMFRMNIQNVYEANGWEILTGRALTNTPANTYCRGPGHIQGSAAIENVMEHIAHHLGKDAGEVRLVNMFQKGSPLIGDYPGVLDEPNPVPELMGRFKQETDYAQRFQDIEEFNANNRWRKRGIALIPIRFPNHFIGGKYNVFVGIYHIDGSVVVSHGGGIEMGQGINTKIAQVVADFLKIPISKVKVKPTNNLIAGNSSLTATGTTSESCCFAAVEACKILLERIAPVKAELGEAAPWEKVIAQAHQKAIDLTASYMNECFRDGVRGYDVWSLAMPEVEVDVLTGEYKISRMDFSIDGTRSVNPEVDLGQVEGALIFGLGLWTTEKVVYDKNTGQLLTAGTWDYKPPEPKDIPEDFRVTLFTQDANKNGVLGSKGPGEPAVCSGVSVIFALRHAINSARKDAGNEDWYEMDGPVTPEDVVRLSLTSVGQMSAI